MKQILDGQAAFGMTLEQFYGQPEIILLVMRRGVMVPPITDVDEHAAPALAYINPLTNGRVRWIAECPYCKSFGRTRAEYVWMSTPLLFCTACANRAIGSYWRPVALPAERDAIERLLLARPDPLTRAWAPGETLEQMTAENVVLLGGGG
jgi:hypothetical protein